MISTHSYPLSPPSSLATPLINISPAVFATPNPNMQINREITQSSLSILSKQHSPIYGSNQHAIKQTYNSEKMECQLNKQTTQLLEPKLISNDIHSSTNCYELFRFSLNSSTNACKYNPSSTSRCSSNNTAGTSLTTCYSSSIYQHSIPNDLINLASMASETFKSNQTLPSIRDHDVHSPSRINNYCNPKFDFPHLNSYQGNSTTSPSLISRSKIIVSASRSSSVTDFHRKSPSFASETSSCKSPSREELPKASLSKIHKPKHVTNKKRSCSSSSTDEEEGKKYNTGTWTRAEHEQFLKGLEEVGKNWKLISENYVQTRKRTQIASHAQKWFLKLSEIKKGGDSSNNNCEELYM